MADDNVDITFSTLVPASRSVEFKLSVRSHNREVPDAYRSCSKSDQSPENLEQQRTVDFADEEMQAVMVNYTARIGDQNLPSSVKDMYRLIVNMTADAMSGFNAHPSISTQKVNAVRCMNRFIREITLNLNSARRDLSERAHDNTLFRFHAHLGDYAGGLCDFLKGTANSKSSLILSQPWTEIVEALDKHDKSVARWIDQGQHSARPYSVHMDAIECRTKQLVELGFTDLDTDLALFAIRSYARRNSIAHGRSFDLYMKKDFAGLAEYLDRVDKTLEDILPDGEKPMAGKWRRLLTFFRDSRIWKSDDGDWVEQTPLKILERSPSPLGQPWRAALCQRIEMGKHRPIGSDGPPPNNVSWDPSSFRRRSEPDIRGLKRPAVEQSVEQPRAKRARVANYSSGSLEAIQAKHIDSDTKGNQRKQLSLLGRISTLAQYNPGTAAKWLDEANKQLDAQLEALIGKIRQRVKDNEPRCQEKGRDILDNTNNDGSSEGLISNLFEDS